MMNLYSKPEEQRGPKMNECRQVVDRIREAGRYDHQETDKLGNSKRVHNGDGDNTCTSPTPSNGDTSSSRGRFALLEQGPDSIPHETSTPLLGSAHFWEKNLADRTLVPSVTPKEQTAYLKRRGEAQKNQLRSDGRTGNLNSQRLFLSEALEEEMAQSDQRPTKLKRSGEVRKCKLRSNGRMNDFSSQRLLLSEALEEEMA
jgi:hypothetical protein